MCRHVLGMSSNRSPFGLKLHPTDRSSFSATSIRCTRYLKCFRYLTLYPVSFHRSDFHRHLLDLRHGSYSSRDVGAYNGPILVRMGRSLGRPVRTDIYTNWRQATAHQADRLHPLQVMGRRYAQPQITNSARGSRVTCRPTNASPSVKPTRVLFRGADFTQLEWGQCPHKPKSWTYTQWNGSSATTWGKHPPLVNSSAKGKAYTAAAAAYPAALNKQISTIISSAKRKHVPLPGNSDDHFPSKRVPKLHFKQPESN
jgi:hypothetical protein